MRITVLVVQLALLLLALPSSDAFLHRRRRRPHGKKGRPRHHSRGRGYVRGFDYVKKSIDSVEKNMHSPYNRHTDYGRSHHHPHSYHHGHHHDPHHGHDHGYPRNRKYAHGPSHGPVIYHEDNLHHMGSSPRGGHYHWYPDSPSHSHAHPHHFDDVQYHDEDYERSYGEDGHIEHSYGSIKKLRRGKKGKGDYFKVGNTHHPVTTFKDVDNSPEDFEELEEVIVPEIESENYDNKDDLEGIRQYDENEVKSRYSGDERTRSAYRSRYFASAGKKTSYPSTIHSVQSDRRPLHSPSVRSNRDFAEGNGAYYSNSDDETLQSPKMSSEYTFLDEIFVKDHPFNRNLAVSSYTFYNMNDVGLTLLPEGLDIYL